MGEFDLNSHRYIVREQNAISWPEVYFPGYGWEEFSPFGGAPLVNRPSAAAGGSADDSANAADDPGADDSEDDSGDLGGDAGAALNGQHNLQWVLYAGFGVLFLVGLGAIGAVVGRIAWERGMDELEYPAQLWEKSLRLTSWLKLGPKAYQTPEEYSRYLQRSVPGSEGIEPIAKSYVRARYGQKTVDPAERARLRSSWIPLRNTLIRRLLHLKPKP